MRKAVYLERIKRLTGELGEYIDYISKELGIEDSPETGELKSAYSAFSKKANEMAPEAYPKNRDRMGLPELLEETRLYCIGERAKLKKKLGI